MYDEINSVIEAYRAADNPDYAIMINGGWGCGKTYYVEHELKDMLRKCRGKLLYASMLGVHDYEQIVTQLLLSSLASTLGVSVEDIRSEYWLGRLLNHLGSTDGLLYKFLHSTISHIWKKRRHKAYQIDKDNTLIVLDDLERALNDEIRTQVLGHLYEDYIRHGYHVVLIGDETRIDEQSSYFECKEKYVRRSLDITMLSGNLVNDFVIQKCSRIDWLHDAIKDDLSLFITQKDIVNLRVVSMLIDGLIDVIAHLGNDVAQKHIVDIFWSLAPLVHAVAIGLFKPQDLVDNACLDCLWTVYLSYTTKEKRVNLTTGMQKACVFYDEYCEPFDRRYIYIPSLFEYALKGVIDGERLIKEITEILDKKQTPEGETLARLDEYWMSEEADILKNIDKVMTFLEDARYGFSDILKIYACFYFIRSKTYVSEWPYSDDMVERFVHYIHLREKYEPIPDRASMFSLQMHRYEDSQLKGIQVLYNEIDRFYEEKLKDSVKDRIDRLFEALKNGDRVLADELVKSAEGEWALFAEIDECKKVEDVANLPVAGLCFIEREVRSNILRVSNSADFERHQIPSINRLANYLDGYVERVEMPLSRRARLRDLTKVLRSAVRHMEEYDANKEQAARVIDS